MMAPKEFPANQMPCRDACSDFRYQMLVIRVKPGAIVLSKAPRKVRSTIMTAQLLAAA